jgi:hypothetical protein
LTGEAGERVAQGVKLQGGAPVEVIVDGEQVRLSSSLFRFFRDRRTLTVLDKQVGAIYSSGSSATLVFLTTALPLAALHPLAATLLPALGPSSSTILASYHLPSYIPPSDSPSSSAASLLYLSSPSPSSSISSLQQAGVVTPFTPPNLLHGLPSILLMLSALQPSATGGSTLLILPTTTTPQPLNGPFSPLSPISQGGGMSIYDAGGPTGLGDPGALFRELAGPRGPLRKVKESLGWGWWDAETRGGNAFEWLEKSRRDRRREEVGSMYM